MFSFLLPGWPTIATSSPGSAGTRWRAPAATSRAWARSPPCRRPRPSWWPGGAGTMVTSSPTSPPLEVSSQQRETTGAQLWQFYLFRCRWMSDLTGWKLWTKHPQCFIMMQIWTKHNSEQPSVNVPFKLIFYSSTFFRNLTTLFCCKWWCDSQQNNV